MFLSVIVFGATTLIVRILFSRRHILSGRKILVQRYAVFDCRADVVGTERPGVKQWEKLEMERLLLELIFKIRPLDWERGSIGNYLLHLPRFRKVYFLHQGLQQSMYVSTIFCILCIIKANVV